MVVLSREQDRWGAGAPSSAGMGSFAGRSADARMNQGEMTLTDVSLKGIAQPVPLHHALDRLTVHSCFTRGATHVAFVASEKIQEKIALE